MLNTIICHDFADKSEKELSEYLKCIPIEQRMHISKLRRELDKMTSIISWGMLCQHIKEEYGIDIPVLSRNQYGKPFLCNRPDIHFSVSHCPLGCGYAISNHPVGFDIQDIRPYNPEIARRCCSNNELAELPQANDPSVLFTQMWTMKESYVKMTGFGLSQGLKTIDTTLLRDKIPVYMKNGCCIAVASAADFPEVEICTT